MRLSTDTGSHLLRETMTCLEGKLDPEAFLRVHRSFIVNLHHVKEVRTDKQGDMAVILANGEKVPNEPNLPFEAEAPDERLRTPHQMLS